MGGRGCHSDTPHFSSRAQESRPTPAPREKSGSDSFRGEFPTSRAQNAREMGHPANRWPQRDAKDEPRGGDWRKNGNDARSDAGGIPRRGGYNQTNSRKSSGRQAGVEAAREINVARSTGLAHRDGSGRSGATCATGAV